MNRLYFIKTVFVLCFLGLFVSGCATPQAVKTLSNEQVKAQEKYLESQRKYFSIIENLVESHINVTEILIKDATKKINDKYKKRALRNIDPSDTKKTKEVLDTLIDNVLSEYKTDQIGLARVKGYLAELKQKHNSMLKAYATILTAQKKLNEYIQLKKADEAVFDQLLGIIGIERENISEAMTSITKIYKEIERFTKGGK